MSLCTFRRIVPAALLALFALPAVGCAASEGGDDDAAKTEQGLSQIAPPPVAIPIAIPETGSVDQNGMMAFVVGKGEAFPLVFHAAKKAVKKIKTGFSIDGDLTLDTPAGPLTLAKAEVVFEWNADKSGIERFSGTVEIPAPGLGALSGFASVGAPARATLGWDYGKNLKTKLDAPMLDDRKYLAFDYTVGASASAGPVSFQAPGGKGGTLVLDPQDPSFFMTGGLLGLDSVGPLSDMALGLSARGLLPFEPQNTWGVEDEAKSFTGHVYAKGKVTLTRIPLSIDGELVVNVDPTGQGRRLGSALPEGVQLGANGTLSFTVDFLKFFTFEVPLAHATVGARITDAEQDAYVSGDVGPDTSWLPTPLPFIPSANAKVAAYVSSDIQKSHLKAEAEYVFKANKLYSLVPNMPQIMLKDIPIAKATLTANAQGIRVTGTASTPPIPILKPKATLAFDASFPEQPENFFMTMAGDLSIADFPLGAASARIDKNGMKAEGTFNTPISQIAMSGAVTGSGADLRGTIKVDLKGLQQVTQTVTDGAVCGYDYVRDGSVCGYETVRDGALCGSTIVKDAAICGSSYVTSAWECGTRTVTDGAICGWNYLKSAYECMASGFSNCKSPKSCDVASSCWVPNSCSIANTCTVAKSCEKAKTCETKVEVPDFDFGTLEGQLRVTVQSGKATGSVSGRVCKDGTCMSLGGARVELGASPRVCVSGLKGAVGEVCGAL